MDRMRSAVSRVVLTPAVAAPLALAIWLSAAGTARAEQQPPPIHGVTGTVATEESTKDTTAAGTGIFSRVARLFGAGKGSTAAENAAADEIMSGLKAGTRVMVGKPPVDGTPAAPETDAVIMDVNPAERTISIRLEDGTRQTLRLADVASSAGDRGVVVFVKNAAGEPTPHYFRRI
jgi:hypothetical protein